MTGNEGAPSWPGLLGGPDPTPRPRSPRAAQERADRKMERRRKRKANRYRVVRWGGAGITIFIVLAVSVVSLVSPVAHLVRICTVTTAPAGTTTVCGAPGIEDYVPELVLVVLFLVPWWRVKYFKLGPFEAGFVEEAINDMSRQALPGNVGGAQPRSDVLRRFQSP